MTDLADPPHSRTRSLQRNLQLLCGFRAFQMTMFPIAIVPLYWRGELGFSMSEIFLLQALFGLFAACLEFPLGYVADRIGYRVAMLLATACSGTGWILLGVADGFWVVLLAELALAFSLSLTSGTDAALMYESLVELDREPEFARWFGRSRSIGAAAEGTAALAAGFLFAVWPPLPFLAQAGMWVINAVLAYLMVEPARHVVRETEAWARVRAIFHYAAVRSPHLRASIVTVLALGLSTFIPVWIIAVYAENAGLPVVWIGPLWAAANYIVAAGLWGSDRASSSLGTTGILVLCVGLIAFGFTGLGFSHALWGFAFYYLICLARGLNGPVLSHIQQRLIPSSDRASLLSINSLLFRGAFFLLGPVIGLGLDRSGEHAVLLLSGLALAPICLLAIAWLSRHSVAEAGAEDL